MTNAQAHTETRPKRVLREIVRWLFAAAILWFLLARLVRDWPTVRGAFDHLAWAWVIAAMVPAFGYLLFRVHAWRAMLTAMGVSTRFVIAARVWMNGEIARYIPGNVWSVVGRVAQASRLNTTRTTVFSSMVLEALMLVVSGAGVCALLLVQYPALQIPGRVWLLIVVAFISPLIANRRIASALIQFIYRLARRTDPAPQVPTLTAAWSWMAVGWVLFAAAQVVISVSLGVQLAVASAVSLAGAFLLAWLFGYLSFFTPSGLGVREAALVALLIPFVDAPTAILIAVVSRVFLIVVELLALIFVNVYAR